MERIFFFFLNSLFLSTEQPITDVVITVPPYYNQVERKAVLHAAEMVNLNVLQLMSDNAAGSYIHLCSSTFHCFIYQSVHQA